eukprot:GHVQ01040533.1.p1 GENE.GHVQ01040533.1~~GHVQ01040533.1.p1  ORF type:complete len:278 (-),score=38.30 GHVQ01040533.1:423-1256(-)
MSSESVHLFPTVETTFGVLPTDPNAPLHINPSNIPAPACLSPTISPDTHQTWRGRKAFFQPSSKDFSPVWHIHKSTSILETGTPTVTELLDCRRRAVPPLRASVDIRKFPNLLEDAKRREQDKTHQLLSCHLPPKKFPVKADQWQQPQDGRRLSGSASSGSSKSQADGPVDGDEYDNAVSCGIGNDDDTISTSNHKCKNDVDNNNWDSSPPIDSSCIWRTSYGEYGKQPPQQYHFTDRFHANGNKFSKSFSDCSKKRNCSLNTSITTSRIHKNLDFN